MEYFVIRERPPYMNEAIYYKEEGKDLIQQKINEYNLPNDALEIIEYDLSETRRYKHNQMNEL